MDFRKEEEMFRFLYIEGNAYHQKQLARFLGMKEKYFYDKFYPKFNKELKRQINDDYVEATKRKQFSYTRLKYDAYQYNENILMAFYRQNKTLRPNELERLTEIITMLGDQPMTKEELVKKFNSKQNFVVDNAFTRSFERSLPELEKLGVIFKTKQTKPYKYKLDYRILETLTLQELIDLYGFVHYVSNAAILSVPGYFLLDTIKEYILHQDASIELDVFSYKYVNFGRILDEYKCMQLLHALEEKKYVQLRYYPKDSKQRAYVSTNEMDKPNVEKFIPLTILFDHQYGRWFFLGQEESEESYRVLKMEGIDEIDIGESHATQSAQLTNQMEEDMESSWLLNMDPKAKVTVEVKFYFDSSLPGRNFIKERVERQGQWGEIVTEEEDSFLYSITVNGTREIKPWIRSFGSSAEVVSPVELRQELMDEWKMIREEYEDV